MKYRIESQDLTYEAEKTKAEFEEYSQKLLDGEAEERWFRIDKWSKNYPII